MRRLAVLGAAAVLAAACSPEPASEPVATAAPAAPAVPDVPAGAYALDKSHASLIFRVNHLGFSNYTARFADWDAKLRFDPARPEAARVTATIDPRSIRVENPPAGFEDTLRGPDWLDVAKHPEISFRSTAVEATGPNTARIAGDFTLHGVTRPVTLEARFNGGYPGHPMDPHARIGFSAEGTFKRSDFGMGYGVPAPGTTMGVGDAVEVRIEAEFTGPPLAAAPTAAASAG